VDIPDDKDGFELLENIIELWLTIRGFSISMDGRLQAHHKGHYKRKEESQERVKRIGAPN